MTKCMSLYVLGYLAHHLYHIQLNSADLIFALIIAITSLIAKRYSWLIYLFFLIFGYLSFSLSSSITNSKLWPSSIIGEKVELLVKVTNPSTYSSIGEVQSLYVGNNSMPFVGHNVRINYPFRDTPNVTIGDYIWVSGVVVEPKIYKNPGSLDLNVFNLKSSIKAQIKINSYFKTNHNRKNIREELISSISDRYSSSKSMPIVLALLFGYKDLIGSKDKSIFIGTGTAHLIAISGLHVGLVYLGVTFVLSNILPATSVRVVGLLFALVYSFLAGFQYPCQRALLFLSLLSFLEVGNRGYNRLQIILITFIIISLWQPYCIYDYGMWMSFIAIISIGVYSGYIFKYKITKTLCFQYVLFLFFIPVGMSGIGTPSYIGVLSNIYAVPVFSFIVMPLLFLFLVLFVYEIELANTIYTIADKVICNVMRLQEVIYESTINFSLIDYYTRDPYIIIFASFVLFCLVIRGMSFSKVHMLTAIILLWVGALDNNIAVGTFHVDVLDVGQGTSVLIRTKKHSLLYDTGTRNAGRYAVKPFLKMHNIKKIDKVVISHWDLDHYGGLDEIKETVNIIDLISSSMRDGVDSLCRSREHWVWDGVDFEFIYPNADDIEKEIKENNRSCVLRISTQTKAFSLLGDIDKRVESSLFESLETNKEEVVLIAHHGSKSSTGDVLLKALSPRLAIISAGRNNRYGHPHSQVIESLLLKNVRMLTTADCGMISVKLTDKNGASVKSSCYEHSLKDKPFSNWA